MLRTVQQKIKSFVYPHGKVHQHYGRYVGWSLFSSILVSVESVLSTHSMLSVVGNISKNISATGLGAVTVKIIQKLAQEDNVVEIYEKINVLNTLGSRVGMGIGLFMACQIPCHTTRLCIMPLLTAVRIYSYQKAIDDLI